MALQSRFESATPPPRAHTFEILLLMTMAPSFFSVDSSSRPILIGAPGKAFCVNTALHWLVGSSGTISVRVMVFGSGASDGTNRKLDVPTRKPSGRAPCAASRCARYSVLDLKLLMQRALDPYSDSAPQRCSAPWQHTGKSREKRACAQALSADWLPSRRDARRAPARRRAAGAAPAAP